MELLCMAKTATVSGENTECTVFMLRNWVIEAGASLEQRRCKEGVEIIIATWTLIGQTGKNLILKGKGEIEFTDSFYVESPVRVEELVQTTATSVLVFKGKNWRLASPKKWMPAILDVDGYPSVGGLNIGGKDYVILALNEGFAARLKSAS
jgi:hypothetical protein